MMELILAGGGFGLFFFLLWAIALREQGQTFDIDVNEGIEPALDGPIDVEELRKDPSKLRTLREKVSAVVYDTSLDHQTGRTIAESWVIDTNGATIEVDKTGKDYDWRVFSAVDRPPEPEKENLEIEQNARWLADALDVPFED